MKHGLKRIEVTLQQLEVRETLGHLPEPPVRTLTVKPLGQRPLPFSFPDSALLSQPHPPASIAPLQPEEPSLVPTLPRTSLTRLAERSRSATNPHLAVGLLDTLRERVQVWQAELAQIVRQAHDLHAEGPIIEGWLESYESELKDTAEVSETWPEGKPDGKGSQRYRLRGLDERGQSWWRDCPPEQVISVSLAVARAQKLRQLLTRQQELEDRLADLAERLVTLMGQMG